MNVWGKRFKLPQLKHESFLIIDHSCKIFLWYLPNWTSTDLWCVVLYVTYSTTHQRLVEVQFGRYQKNVLQEWSMVKNLSCVSLSSKELDYFLNIFIAIFFKNPPCLIRGEIFISVSGERRFWLKTTSFSISSMHFLHRKILHLKWLFLHLRDRFSSWSLHSGICYYFLSHYLHGFFQPVNTLTNCYFLLIGKNLKK